jgi:hypothetical protein
MFFSMFLYRFNLATFCLLFSSARRWEVMGGFLLVKEIPFATLFFEEKTGKIVH